MATNPDIDKLLADGRVFITYVPLRTEVPFREFLPVSPAAQAYEIAPRAALDPAAEAARSRAAVADRAAGILIPGRRFDASGTRHGQGGGWYDRFLALVSAKWLRIGFCFERQLSEEPLRRETWDQVMDYLFVVDEKTGACRIIETHARN